MKNVIILTLLGLSMLVSLGGCGQSDKVPLNTVEGTILYHGKPATGAFVVFHPESPSEKIKKLRPAATVDTEGKFHLATYEPNDGIPSGNYKVTVIWPSGSSDNSESTAADRLMGRYSNFRTTPLQVTIDPDHPQPISLDLQ